MQQTYCYFCLGNVGSRSRIPVEVASDEIPKTNSSNLNNNILNCIFVRTFWILLNTTKPKYLTNTTDYKGVVLKDSRSKYLWKFHKCLRELHKNVCEFWEICALTTLEIILPARFHIFSIYERNIQSSLLDTPKN